MKNLSHLLFVTAMPLCSFAKPISVEIQAQWHKPEHLIADTVFGHFLERASFGEPGPEWAYNAHKKAFSPEMFDAMSQLQLPLVRFPGGTDIDYMDWRDMIDLPHRQQRPISLGHTNKAISNNFGYPEFLKLQQELKFNSLIVLNFRDVLLAYPNHQDAIAQHSSLLAYLMAENNALDQSPWREWAQLGSEELSYRGPIKYVQIGNEWGYFMDDVLQQLQIESPQEAARVVAQVLADYLRVVKQIAPSVRTIADGWMNTGADLAVLRDSDVKRQLDLLALHSYAPGPMHKVTAAHGTEAKSQSQPLSDKQWWYVWSSMPGEFEHGSNQAIASKFEPLMPLGYEFAITEWNFNAWGWEKITPRPNLHFAGPAGIATASFLMALMRNERVELATQSLLLGSHWDITGIRWEEGEMYTYPQLEVNKLLSEHQNQHHVAINIDNVPKVAVTQGNGWVLADKQKRVAEIETVASVNACQATMTLIQRSWDTPYTVEITPPTQALSHSHALPKLTAWQARSTLRSDKAWGISSDTPKINQERGKVTFEAKAKHIYQLTWSLCSAS